MTVMKNWHLMFLSIVVILVIAEIGARLHIMKNWPDEEVRAYTHHSAEKGRYSSHPYLPFVLRGGYVTPNGRYSNNSYGFRGKEFDIEKPEGVFRIVAIGASTTYGVANSDENTYPTQLERIIRENGYKNVEVLNAGVTGYTTIETFLNFYLRVLDLSPDMVIFYQARNDVFPQAFNDYMSDFQHFRQPDYSFGNTNYLHKYLFRISHLFMWLSTRGDGNFGWSKRDENPHYGTVKYENRPTNSELIDNLSNDQGLITYRKNVESIITLSKQNGIQVVLSTYAFLKEKYSSGIIKRDEAILPAIEKQIDKANEIVRQIAADHQLVLVDTARELAASLDDYLVDGCHFNDKGQQARAALIFAHIEKDLPKKSLN
jgi:lysophospholipase L1-like esterase